MHLFEWIWRKNPATHLKNITPISTQQTVFKQITIIIVKFHYYDKPGSWRFLLIPTFTMTIRTISKIENLMTSDVFLTVYCQSLSHDIMNDGCQKNIK